MHAQVAPCLASCVWTSPSTLTTNESAQSAGPLAADGLCTDTVHPAFLPGDPAVGRPGAPVPQRASVQSLPSTSGSSMQTTTSSCCWGQGPSSLKRTASTWKTSWRPSGWWTVTACIITVGARPGCFAIPTHPLSLGPSFPGRGSCDLCASTLPIPGLGWGLGNKLQAQMSLCC